MSQLAQLKIPAGDGSNPSSSPVIVPQPSNLPVNLNGPDALANLMQLGITYLFGLAGVLAVVFVMFNGLRYITSGGDVLKIASAKKGLMYSIIGLAVVVLSFFIVTVVIFLTGGNPAFFFKLS